MGHLSIAKTHILEAIELSQITGNAPDILDSLSLLGQILAADSWEDAVILLSLVANHAVTRWMARDRSQQVLQGLKQAMPPMQWAAAVARGEAAALDDILDFVTQYRYT
jgi:hypothetical protein